MSLARYFHTLRYLRPVQFSGRLWHRLNRSKPDLRAAPALGKPSGQWRETPKRPALMLDAMSFRFLNVFGQVRCAADWNDKAQEKLWLYNLHYFDDLNAVGAQHRTAWHRSLLDRWVTENPPCLGNAWEPYPTSLRIVNWIKWALADNELEIAWTHSLAVQVRCLRQHIEWHLLGNHLFVNAKALIFAGLFFTGDEAAEWLTQGLKILAREIPEQVLPDGGHFELSPMYHAIILEDLLDLLNITSAIPGQAPEAVIAQWRAVARRMLGWLKGMTHPDGEIAFFNDAAIGIARRYSVLEAYSRRLGIEPLASEQRKPCKHFTDSGYLRFEQNNAVALLDVARIGPDYLPGHAHADTLSFELSLFGQRVVVNSGTSQYGLGAERLRQRGTAAHSTLVIDGADSSEVWGGFRVARRAKPFGLMLELDGDAPTAICAHDGYRRLPGKPIHRRRWRLDKSGLQISDVIDGDFRTAVARFYLHPSVAVAGIGDKGQMQLPDGKMVSWSAMGGKTRIVSATWHPEFGSSMPNNCIEVVLDGHEAHFVLSWD